MLNTKITHRILLLHCCLFALLVACKEDPIDPILFGSIEGLVLDENNNALDNVSISTAPPTEVVTTDGSGKFSLTNVETGNYTIRAEKSGFLSELESIKVSRDEISNVSFILNENMQDNVAPSLAFAPSPANGSEDLEISIQLRWSSYDPDQNDELTFDLLLLDPVLQTDTLIASDLSDSSFVLKDLNFGTKYYWQIITKDGQNDPVYGEVWDFRTKAFPNHRFLFVKENGGTFDIYSANENEQNLRLTSNGASNWRPRLSPDRRKIAFISNLGLEPQLYSMNRDGSDVQKLTTIGIIGPDHFELDFAWSPTNDQLIYVSNNKLYKINVNGTGLEKIAEAPSGQSFSACDWSPQGNRIAVRTTGPNNFDNEIFLLDANGVFLRKLVANTRGNTGNPQFSVDGRFILYTKDISGFESADNRQLNSQIILLDINTLAKLDLSLKKPAGTNDLEPRFSPTGAEIIFTNTDNDEVSPRNIYKMDLTGNNRSLLFKNALMPDWR